MRYMTDSLHAGIVVSAVVVGKCHPDLSPSARAIAAEPLLPEH